MPVKKKTKTPKGKTIDQEQFDALRDQLDEALEISTGFPAVPPPDDDLDPSITSLREALEEEGVTRHFLARKIKHLLEAKTPKWNMLTKRWDYFIDAELQRRLVEMGIKIYGGFDTGPQVKVNVNVALEGILRDPMLTPEQQREKIREFREKAISVAKEDVRQIDE
jgi:hypothetical protein